MNIIRKNPQTNKPSAGGYYTFGTKYDGNGNMIKTTDGRGNSKNMEYDALNRLVTGRDEKDYASQIVYDAAGRITGYTDGEGAVTGYTYDKNGNVTKITDALGHSTSITYDVMNRVSTITDARGAVTAYEYTPTGNIAKITDALGGEVTYEYDILGRRTKETNENGEPTTYTYDALGRVITVTNALGHSDRLAYDAVGRVTSVTDRNGNITKYTYDANGNIVQTTDALGNSSHYEYDAMNRLVKVTLNRKNTRQNVNENQITLYQYDKRGLMTKTINAASGSVIYVYDQNGNLTQTTDEDGYVTEYGYDEKNLVEAINYADGKEARYAYDKEGRLTLMTDWNGETEFTVDLLGQLTGVSDHADRETKYTYDEVGNQTKITYPDATAAQYAYDLLGRLTELTDAEKQQTIYAYDAASQLIEMNYPNGWAESYTYDATGRLLRQYAEDPTKTASKSTEHKYTYDPEGNILNEYRSGAGGQDKYDLTHTYDALNRLTQTTGQWGYATHTYEYDSLGNLVYEKNGNGNKAGNEYWYNSQNEQTRKQVDGKDYYSYTYDKRGNRIKETSEKKNEVTARYTYDASNRMVKGVNASGEESHYIYNGLGVLVANEWIIEKNAYGYAGLNTTPSGQVNGVAVCDRHSNTTGQGHQNPTGQGHFTTGGTEPMQTPAVSGKQQVVHKDYAVDYTSETRDILMEYESGADGLTYRYTYGLEKNNVVMYGIPNGAGSIMQNYEYPNGSADIVKLYYHQDRLGSSDYLTDNVTGKVTSYTSYDDWGAQTMKAVLKLGVRQLDLVSGYTGYTYDAVVGAYYAKARMYDAANRRFTAADPVKGMVADAQTMAQYTYCLNNPIKYVDPLGLAVTKWDEEHLDKTELAELEANTAAWLAADAAGNKDAKDEANEKSEAIRNKYRTGTER